MCENGAKRNKINSKSHFHTDGIINHLPANVLSSSLGHLNGIVGNNKKESKREENQMRMKRKQLLFTLY
jgi:hypothetical protein